MNKINFGIQFWDTSKPDFTGRTLKDEKITLVDGDKVTTEKKEAVEKLKDHFEKIVETLQTDLPILSDLNPSLNFIEKCSHH